MNINCRYFCGNSEICSYKNDWILVQSKALRPPEQEMPTGYIGSKFDVVTPVSGNQPRGFVRVVSKQGLRK